jgi:hypothetical protein
MSNNKALETTVLICYLTVVAAGIFGVFFLPEEYATLRRVSGFVIYGFGLPVGVVFILVLMKNKGWLK